MELAVPYFNLNLKFKPSRKTVTTAIQKLWSLEKTKLLLYQQLPDTYFSIRKLCNQSALVNPRLNHSSPKLRQICTITKYLILRLGCLILCSTLSGHPFP